MDDVSVAHRAEFSAIFNTLNTDHSMPFQGCFSIVVVFSVSSKEKCRTGMQASQGDTGDRLLCLLAR